jgi:pyridoxine/pyridoxamine 5'-phosphate oxidase
MTVSEPLSERNIDVYNLPPIAWEEARERLERATEHVTWLATTRPDGRPHVMRVGMVWLDGVLYFTSSTASRKARNLADNPHCAMSFTTDGLDVVVEGEAELVRDDATLQRVAEAFASRAGWAPTVRDGAFFHDYSAPSAGPPPWHVYAIRPQTVFGLGTAEPYGATRWRL